MARNRANEKRIFFPWERQGGWIRRWRLQRARPFAWAALGVVLVIAIAVRERGAAGERRTRAIMHDVRNALEHYMAEHDGRCPSRFEDLERYAHFKGVPRDAWGTPLRLTCPSPRGDLPYLLSSDGPDRMPGGLDRID
jgi:hypothetical protein